MLGITLHLHEGLFKCPKQNIVFNKQLTETMKELMLDYKRNIRPIHHAIKYLSCPKACVGNSRISTEK